MDVHSAWYVVTNGFERVNFCFRCSLVFGICGSVADWAYVENAGKGPIDNLIDHLANPAAINFTTNGVSLPGIPYMQP